jgi:hypothetical protein
MATTRSAIAGAATAAVVVTGLLAACGGDPLECKDTKHKTAVQFELQAPYEGKETPETQAAKAQAQSKWEAEVKGKYGGEWASWSNTRSRSSACSAPAGQKAGACEAEAAPCRKKG